jgi:hypothetical protein
MPTMKGQTGRKLPESFLNSTQSRPRKPPKRYGNAISTVRAGCRSKVTDNLLIRKGNFAPNMDINSLLVVYGLFSFLNLATLLRLFVCNGLQASIYLVILLSWRTLCS